MATWRHDKCLCWVVCSILNPGKSVFWRAYVYHLHTTRMVLASMRNIHANVPQQQVLQLKPLARPSIQQVGSGCKAATRVGLITAVAAAGMCRHDFVARSATDSRTASRRADPVAAADAELPPADRAAIRLGSSLSPATTAAEAAAVRGARVTEATVKSARRRTATAVPADTYRRTASAGPQHYNVLSITRKQRIWTVRDSSWRGRRHYVNSFSYNVKCHHLESYAREPGSPVYSDVSVKQPIPRVIRCPSDLEDSRHPSLTKQRVGYCYEAFLSASMSQWTTIPIHA